MNRWRRNRGNVPNTPDPDGFFVPDCGIHPRGKALSAQAPQRQIKKGRQGMPPNPGMDASNRVVHSQHHRCEERSVKGTFYTLPKKRGCSLSTPAFDASPPFTEKEATRE